MPPAKDTKIWNDELVEALNARKDLALREGKRIAITWKVGAEAIDRVRKDIYTFKTGRIVNLPSDKLHKTVDNLCREIIAGTKPIHPPGYAPITQQQRSGAITTNPFEKSSYMKSMKIRGGSFAILMALYVVKDHRHDMTEEQLCTAAQPYCDEAMQGNWNAGRPYGAIANKKTLIKYGFLGENKVRASWNARAGGFRSNSINTYYLTREGELFIEALFRYKPEAKQQIGRQHGQPRVKSSYMSATQGTVGTSGFVAINNRTMGTTQSPTTQGNVNASEGGDLTFFGTPTKRPATKMNGFDSTPELAESSEYEAFPEASSLFTRTGRRLNGEYGTPTKRAKDSSVVAGEAALKHHEASRAVQRGSSRRELFAVDQIDDSKEALDTKTKARKSKSVTKLFSENVSKSTTVAIKAKKKTPEVLEILDSDDDDGDELLQPIFRKKNAGPVVEVIDLISPGEPQPLCSKNLHIFIDDRERIRNAQPRYLRMQLNELLSSPNFLAVRPAQLGDISVVEKTLPVGDFSFYINDGTDNGGMDLPVCLERKRIGDLVQRSAHKDHWRQLLRGQESSVANILLLEGDFRTANAYQAFGSINTGEPWSPWCHMINDESSLLRALSRAMLSIHNVRLIQTREEQDTLRAVVANAVVASMSLLADESKQVPIFASINTEKHRLSDRLVNGGIPAELASIIAEEVGSVPALQRLYATGECDDCNDNILVPLLSSYCERSNQNATNWSKAIHTTFFSAASNVSETKRIFNEYKQFASDEARLLVLLHQGMTVDRAIDEIYTSTVSDTPEPQRVVRITLSSALKECFPDANAKGAFFRLKESEVLAGELPRLRMWTETEDFWSEFVDLSLLEGDSLVEMVLKAMAMEPNSLQAARRAARQVLSKISDPSAKNILILRGLRPALDRIARSPGYKPETRLVVDMVCAELSLTHGIILFQAVRKTGDLEAFVREFALACFHYQLLTRKRPRC